MTLLRNTALLLGVLAFTGCTKTHIKTVRVPIPAEVCKLPPTQLPAGKINLVQMRGEDGSQIVAMTERDFRVLSVFLELLLRRNALVDKCPGVVIDESMAAEVNIPEERPVVTTQRDSI